MNVVTSAGGRPGDACETSKTVPELAQGREPEGLAPVLVANDRRERVGGPTQWGLEVPGLDVVDGDATEQAIERRQHDEIGCVDVAGPIESGPVVAGIDTPAEEVAGTALSLDLDRGVVVGDDESVDILPVDAGRAQVGQLVTVADDRVADADDVGCGPVPDRIEHPVVVPRRHDEVCVGLRSGVPKPVEGVLDRAWDGAERVEEVAGDDHPCRLVGRKQVAEPLEDVSAVAHRELEPAAGPLAQVEVGDHEDVVDQEGAVAEGQVGREVHGRASAPDGQMGLERVFATRACLAGMVDLLESKRDATRFRVLVEIADRQPAVSQGEIANAVGVTSQAVSEYIRDLVEEGLVEKEGRSRYRVTQEGVDWLFNAASGVQRFIDHVTEDVLGGVQEDAAIADRAITEGETVTLTMEDGLLHATPGDLGDATGVATTAAEIDDVVGVTGFEGIIDLDPGQVTVLTIPPVRSDERPDGRTVSAACRGADVVCAAGVEAVVALDRLDVDIDTWFAPGAVAADAATRGLDAVVVTTTDALGRVTDALRDEGVAYEVTE